MIVYQAQHHPIERLDPRPIKNYNSMGTWFTSSPEHARMLYGPLVYAFELPKGRYLEAHTYDFDQFFTNWPLAEEILPKKEFAYLRSHAPGTDDFDHKADRLVRKLLLDPDYIRGFREIIENANYDGIVWKNSRIDLRPGDPPHDVYLVFQKEPLYPIDKAEIETVRGKS